MLTPSICQGVLLREAQRSFRAVLTLARLLSLGLFIISAIFCFNFDSDGLRNLADPYSYTSVDGLWTVQEPVSAIHTRRTGGQHTQRSNLMTTIEQVDLEAMRRGLEMYHDVVRCAVVFEVFPIPASSSERSIRAARGVNRSGRIPPLTMIPNFTNILFLIPNCGRTVSNPWKDDPELARLRAAIDARYAALFVQADGSLLPVDECYPPDDNWAEGSFGFCDPCRSEWEELERYWADPAVLASLWLEAARRLECLLGINDHEVWGDTRVRDQQRKRRERIIELAHSGETLAESWAREKR